MVEQVFIWVVKDTDSANSIVTILESSGFRNIQLDSKGTTITAQSSATINNEPTTSATAADSSCPNNTSKVSSCSNAGLTSSNCKAPYYVACSVSGGIGCTWNGSSCSDGGCNDCVK